ncbi:hypothetical protein [Dyella sp.]|uniref:hypothetical protein n=1 Tax=Dyella sp. TaxID=1869338 RepID=UPI002FD923A3
MVTSIQSLPDYVATIDSSPLHAPHAVEKPQTGPQLSPGEGFVANRSWADMRETHTSMAKANSSQPDLPPSAKAGSGTDNSFNDDSDLYDVTPKGWDVYENKLDKMGINELKAEKDHIRTLAGKEDNPPRQMALAMRLDQVNARIGNVQSPDGKGAI